jgi:hypothetical protein
MSEYVIQNGDEEITVTKEEYDKIQEIQQSLNTQDVHKSING